MMADSTSRWAEALREISGRLAEMPGDSGYPAYLATKLAQFYERAGKVTCLGSPNRQGSVTIVGAVSPPGGDFTDPVTTATLSIVQVFWGLDKKLAQKKHFPSVNWTISTSSYEKQLEPYFNQFDKEFSTLRQRVKEVLQEEVELNEIVQLVGRDSLSEDQKLTLEIANIIKNEFLQQNAFSKHDYTCPLEKTIGMMKCIVHYYELAKKAIYETAKRPDRINYAFLKSQTSAQMNKLKQMKFEDPKGSRQEIQGYFTDFIDEINNAFKKLMDR